MSEPTKFVWPKSASDYELLQPIGVGSQATIVWRARCVENSEEVAIKIIDLVNCSSGLEEIRKEIHVMSLCNHEKVVAYHCSFVTGDHLWLVMQLLAGGSCLDIMKYAFPQGLEETLIASILVQALQGIEYFHKTGRIHRDIKAGNLVVGTDGIVKISDFGVSAWLDEGGERRNDRRTFVGTPCWMAPEVMEQVRGYDYRADIWSFGITAIELARGQAPFAKLSPMKVMVMILSNPAPCLSEQEKSKYSKHFNNMIEMCLQKDPSKRPTATKLLEHKFFKQSKPPDYIKANLLAKLPPLWERAKATHPQIRKLAKGNDSTQDSEDNFWDLTTNTSSTNNNKADDITTNNVCIIDDLEPTQHPKSDNPSENNYEPFDTNLFDEEIRNSGDLINIAAPVSAVGGQKGRFLVVASSMKRAETDEGEKKGRFTVVGKGNQRHSGESVVYDASVLSNLSQQMAQLMKQSTAQQQLLETLVGTRNHEGNEEMDAMALISALQRQVALLLQENAKLKKELSSLKN